MHTHTFVVFEVLVGCACQREVSPADSHRATSSSVSAIHLPRTKKKGFFWACRLRNVVITSSRCHKLQLAPASLPHTCTWDMGGGVDS